MKRKFLLASLLLCSMAAMRAEACYKECHIDDDKEMKRLTTPLKPTYLEDVVSTGGWASNWFLEVKGGASAFVGKPVGCGDLFDRIMPSLNIGLGKWFTPAVGTRLGYQGLKFKNANLEKMKYYHIHADLMINLTSNLQPRIWYFQI